MGWFSDIFGSQQQQQSSIPPYLEEFYKNQVTPRATAFLDRPYPVYGNARIEDFAPEEQQAFDRISNDALTGDAWGPLLARSISMTDEGSADTKANILGPGGSYTPSLIGDVPTLSADAVAKYMDPYQDKVVDAAIGKINESADRAALRDRGRATRAGNLYSAGHGIIDAERDKNVAREIGDTTGRLMSEGYRTALGQFNTEAARNLQTATTDAAAKNRAVEFLMSQGLTREQANQAAVNQMNQFNRNNKLAGARQLSGLAQQNQAMRDQGWDRLMKVGQQKRGMGQQNLDLAYKDFMDQYDYPLNNLDRVSKIMSGQPYSRDTTTTSTNSPFNTVAGAALIGSKLFGFADGGMVPDIHGPRGPAGPALSRPKRRATMTPGRQDFGGLPPPRTLMARRMGPDSYAA